MPLLDHFHPPLAGRRHWESFHAAWANAIMDALNRVLPDGFFAEEQVHNGPRFEIDVAAYDERDARRNAVAGGGTTTIAQPASELPLALGGLGHVPVNLEATYEDAHDRSRL